ncbi:FAD dependent oxidoreductase [Solidesulfovibrio fructosivorans JJ]]|uniref:FAD dependent oxidoreductase n=2 Tax=Solidesulfovibrio fructosivorans TaxID=878 RepID=E1JTB8_SOLFR|nr:FAD dependent oxidoreductase [Solidesulfovibrio fructosivorans JJ]]
MWRGVMTETHTLDKGLAESNRSQFPTLFPNLWMIRDKTVGQLVDAHVRDPKLKAILTQSCGYYGLPPSQLSAFYYLLPTGDYLENGGSYVKGTSQNLSNALAKAVTDAGGEVLYGTRVGSIVMGKGRVTGVKTHDGREFKAKVVVCNASAPQVFGKLLPSGSVPKDERSKLETYTYSPSSFIVWLGLNRDITKQFSHPAISYYASYDQDANYKNAIDCNFKKSGFSLMVYDNLVSGYSPSGCSSVSIMGLCGYGAWKEMEGDYLAGRKTQYNKKKQKLTDLLISLAEERAIPGLSKMIVMSDSATPLTNFRFTLNTAGALYGYNQSTDNSFMSRLSNKTGVPGLYLASAWGNPGGGFGGALLGGKSAFKSIAEDKVA